MTNKNKEALTYAHGNRYIINGVEYVPALEARAVDVALHDFACRISDTVWGGELGWSYHNGLENLANEVKKRLSRKPIDWDGLRKTPQQVEEQHPQEHGDYWQAWRHGWNAAIEHIIKDQNKTKEEQEE